MLQRELLFAAIGTGFTCLATVLGAAMVFVFRKELSHTLQKVFLGFAAGVMIAASVWSLLIPAMEMAEGQGRSILLPVGGGFVLGGVFLMLLDQLLPHLHLDSDQPEGLRSRVSRTAMLVFAVTLHNLPEGMAVGLACALAASSQDAGQAAGAAALALGIGLQNFPEGAAIALPLRREGASRLKSFAGGALSGAVEPLGGILAVLAAGWVEPLMPWLLSFAAGAMVYVVAQELIPEARRDETSRAGTWGVLLGFVIMMVMDVALG